MRKPPITEEPPKNQEVPKMIWNGDCSVEGCEREAMNAEGKCRRHSRHTLNSATLNTPSPDDSQSEEEPCDDRGDDVALAGEFAIGTTPTGSVTTAKMSGPKKPTPSSTDPQAATSTFRCECGFNLTGATEYEVEWIGEEHRSMMHGGSRDDFAAQDCCNRFAPTDNHAPGCEQEFLPCDDCVSYRRSGGVCEPGQRNPDCAPFTNWRDEMASRG